MWYHHHHHSFCLYSKLLTRKMVCCLLVLATFRISKCLKLLVCIYACLVCFLLSMYSYAYTHMTKQTDYCILQIVHDQKFCDFRVSIDNHETFQSNSDNALCNRVWSHNTSVQPWMFSSELQFISTTTNLFYLKWFVYICNIQYTMHAPHHIASVFIHNLHICTYICTPISTHTLTATHTYTPGSYISMNSSGYLLCSN